MWTASSVSNRRCSRRALLAATLGVFVILLFLWIWIRRPAGTPSGSNYKTPQARRPLQPARLRSNSPKLNRFKPESTNRNQQARRPLQPARLRSTDKPKMSRFKPESTTRNQPDPSNTNYSKLNITYAERVETNCSGVFISVRTTVEFHKSRLLLLLHTWLQTVDPKQVQIITDFVNDSRMDPAIDAAKTAGFRVMTTHCTISHKRSPLCCKTGHEFEQYYRAIESGQSYRWYCHFDDDEYVNVPVLMRTLRVHKDKLYLGHWPQNHDFPFRYANGPAYCISSTLMPKLEKFIRGKRTFTSTCNKYKHPDDVTLGAIIETTLGYNLTDVPKMLNQLSVTELTRKQSRITLKNLSCTQTASDKKRKVTVAYNWRRHKGITVPGAMFTKEQDPTGFLSYHCLLHSSTSWCSKNRFN